MEYDRCIVVEGIPSRKRLYSEYRGDGGEDTDEDAGTAMLFVQADLVQPGAVRRGGCAIANQSMRATQVKTGR